jgi:hypothetical protein
VLAAVLAALLVGGVVAAATVSSDDGAGSSASASSTSAPAGFSPAPATTALGQPGGGELVGPPITGPGGPLPTTIPGGTSGTAAPAGASSPAGQSATTVTQAPAPPAPKGARFAAPGTYTYDVQGRSKSAFGEQDQSGRTTTVYDPPQGADQRSLAKGGSGTTEQILRSTADAALLQYLRIDAGVFTMEFRPDPGVLALPRDAKTGRTWTWRMTSTDGKITIDSTFLVTRTESVVIGGKPVAAIVIDSTMKITSDTVKATSTSTRWVSADLALIVKDSDHTEGTFQGTAFSTDAARTLTSTTPT